MPSDHQHLLGNDGTPHEVEFRDRRWKLHYLDQKAKSAIVAQLKEAARKEITGVKDMVDPDTYRLMLAEWVKACGSGEYEYFGAEHQRALRTERGNLQMLRAMLGPEQSSQLSDDDVRELAETPDAEAVYLLIMEESLPPKMRPLFRVATEQAKARRAELASASPKE